MTVFGIEIVCGCIWDDESATGSMIAGIVCDDWYDCNYKCWVGCSGCADGVDCDDCTEDVRLCCCSGCWYWEDCVGTCCWRLVERVLGVTLDVLMTGFWADFEMY
jgi:hypothetical protein